MKRSHCIFQWITNLFRLARSPQHGRSRDEKSLDAASGVACPYAPAIQLSSDGTGLFHALRTLFLVYREDRVSMAGPPRNPVVVRSIKSENPFPIRMFQSDTAGPFRSADCAIDIPRPSDRAVHRRHPAMAKLKGPQNP
jgi:hypothetical protein